MPSQPWDDLPSGAIEEIQNHFSGHEWLVLRCVSRWWRQAASSRVRVVRVSPHALPALDPSPRATAASQVAVPAGAVGPAAAGAAGSSAGHATGAAAGAAGAAGAGGAAGAEAAAGSSAGHAAGSAAGAAAAVGSVTGHAAAAAAIYAAVAAAVSAAPGAQAVAEMNGAAAPAAPDLDAWFAAGYAAGAAAAAAAAGAAHAAVAAAVAALTGVEPNANAIITSSGLPAAGLPAPPWATASGPTAISEPTGPTNVGAAPTAHPIVEAPDMNGPQQPGPSSGPTGAPPGHPSTQLPLPPEPEYIQCMTEAGPRWALVGYRAPAKPNVRPLDFKRLLSAFPRMDTISIYLDTNCHLSSPLPWDVPFATSAMDNITAVLGALGAMPSCPPGYTSSRPSMWLASSAQTRNPDTLPPRPAITGPTAPRGAVGDIKLELWARPSINPLNFAFDESQIATVDPTSRLCEHWRHGVSVVGALLDPRGWHPEWDLPTKIRSLELNLALGALPRSLAHLTALTELRILVPLMVQPIMSLSLVHDCTTLKQLYIQAALGMPASELAMTLARLPCLTHLEIETEPSNLYWVQTPILAGCTKLQTLWLQNVVLEDVQQLLSCPLLKEVTLTIEAGHPGARYLWRTLHALPNLISVGLHSWVDVGGTQDEQVARLRPVALPPAKHICAAGPPAPPSGTAHGSATIAGLPVGGASQAWAGPTLTHPGAAQSAPATGTSTDMLIDEDAVPLHQLTRLTSLGVLLQPRASLKAVGCMTCLRELSLLFQRDLDHHGAPMPAIEEFEGYSEGSSEEGDWEPEGPDEPGGVWHWQPPPMLTRHQAPPEPATVWSLHDPNQPGPNQPEALDGDPPQPSQYHGVVPLGHLPPGHSLSPSPSDGAGPSEPVNTAPSAPSSAHPSADHASDMQAGPRSVADPSALDMPLDEVPPTQSPGRLLVPKVLTHYPVCDPPAPPESSPVSPTAGPSSSLPQPFPPPTAVPGAPATSDLPPMPAPVALPPEGTAGPSGPFLPPPPPSLSPSDVRFLGVTHGGVFYGPDEMDAFMAARTNMEDLEAFSDEEFDQMEADPSEHHPPGGLTRQSSDTDSWDPGPYAGTRAIGYTSWVYDDTPLEAADHDLSDADVPLDGAADHGTDVAEAPPEAAGYDSAFTDALPDAPGEAPLEAALEAAGFDSTDQRLQLANLVVQALVQAGIGGADGDGTAGPSNAAAGLLGGPEAVNRTPNAAVMKAVQHLLAGTLAPPEFQWALAPLVQLPLVASSPGPSAAGDTAAPGEPSHLGSTHTDAGPSSAAGPSQPSFRGAAVRPATATLQVSSYQDSRLLVHPFQPHMETGGPYDMSDPDEALASEGVFDMNSVKGRMLSRLAASVPILPNVEALMPRSVCRAVAHAIPWTHPPTQLQLPQQQLGSFTAAASQAATDSAGAACDVPPKVPRAQRRRIDSRDGSVPRGTIDEAQEDVHMEDNTQVLAHSADPPVSSQPGTSQPASSQPATGQPASGQPGTIQPAASQPATSQPASSQPGTSRSHASQPLPSHSSLPGPSRPSLSRAAAAGQNSLPTMQLPPWLKTLAEASGIMPAAASGSNNDSQDTKDTKKSISQSLGDTLRQAVSVVLPQLVLSSSGPGERGDALGDQAQGAAGAAAVAAEAAAGTAAAGVTAAGTADEAAAGAEAGRAGAAGVAGSAPSLLGGPNLGAESSGLGTGQPAGPSQASAPRAPANVRSKGVQLTQPSTDWWDSAPGGVGWSEAAHADAVAALETWPDYLVQRALDREVWYNYISNPAVRVMEQRWHPAEGLIVLTTPLLHEWAREALNAWSGPQAQDVLKMPDPPRTWFGEWGLGWGQLASLMGANWATQSKSPHGLHGGQDREIWWCGRPLQRSPRGPWLRARRRVRTATEAVRCQVAVLLWALFPGMGVWGTASLPVEEQGRYRLHPGVIRHVQLPCGAKVSFRVSQEHAACLSGEGCRFCGRAPAWDPVPVVAPQPAVAMDVQQEGGAQPPAPGAVGVGPPLAAAGALQQQPAEGLDILDVPAAPVAADGNAAGAGGVEAGAAAGLVGGPGADPGPAAGLAAAAAGGAGAGAAAGPEGAVPEAAAAAGLAGPGNMDLEGPGAGAAAVAIPDAGLGAAGGPAQGAGGVAVPGPVAPGGPAPAPIPAPGGGAAPAPALGGGAPAELPLLNGGCLWQYLIDALLALQQVWQLPSLAACELHDLLPALQILVAAIGHLQAGKDITYRAVNAGPSPLWPPLPHIFCVPPQGRSPSPAPCSYTSMHTIGNKSTLHTAPSNCHAVSAEPSQFRGLLEPVGPEETPPWLLHQSRLDMQLDHLLPPLHRWLSGQHQQQQQGQLLDQLPVCRLTSLCGLNALQLVHVFDCQGKMPMPQAMLPLLGAWWSSLRELNLQCKMDFLDLTVLDLPNLALLDLYNSHNAPPIHVALHRLPPKLTILGLQNARVWGAHRALGLAGRLKNLSLNHPIYWEPFLNGGERVVGWAAHAATALTSLTLELGARDYAAAMPTDTPCTPLSDLRHAPNLIHLELLFSNLINADQEDDQGLLGFLDDRLMMDIAAITRLEKLEMWTAYGDDWAPDTNFTHLTALTRLRALSMEALPLNACFPLRKALTTAVPQCRMRLVADNEPQEMQPQEMQPQEFEAEPVVDLGLQVPAPMDLFPDPMPMPMPPPAPQGPMEGIVLPPGGGMAGDQPWPPDGGGGGGGGMANQPWPAQVAVEAPPIGLLAPGFQWVLPPGPAAADQLGDTVNQLQPPAAGAAGQGGGIAHQQQPQGGDGIELLQTPVPVDGASGSSGPGPAQGPVPPGPSSHVDGGQQGAGSSGAAGGGGGSAEGVAGPSGVQGLSNTGDPAPS